MSEKTYSSLIESLAPDSTSTKVVYRLENWIDIFSLKKEIKNNENNIRILIQPESTLSRVIDTSMKFTIGNRYLLKQKLSEDTYDENNIIIGLDNDNGLHAKEIEIRFNHKINKWIVVLLESSLNYIKIFRHGREPIRLKLGKDERQACVVEHNDIIHIGIISEFNKRERYHQIQILNGHHYDNSENECSENDSY